MRFLPILLIAFCSTLGAAEWLTTYSAGLKKAETEKKDMLIAFMGSDWCDQCKVLKEAVLSKDIFTGPASEKFVLVELDFPQTKPEIATRNEPIRVKYWVKGYPVLVLADSEGKPYGEVRYQLPWKTSDYLNEFKALAGKKAQRDEAQSELEAAETDAQKTEALEKFLKAVPPNSVSRSYAEELALLRKVSKDQSPFVKDIVTKERAEKMQSKLQTLMGQRKHREAVSLCEEFLAIEDLKSNERQMGLTFQYYNLMPLRRYEEALQAATALRDIDPKSGIAKQARGMVQRAEAALAARPAKKPVKPIKPVQPGKPAEGKGEMLAEEKEKEPSVAKTEGVKPAAAPASPLSETHQNSLKSLDVAHEKLAAAEQSLREAIAQFEKAEAQHKAAHQQEVAARRDAEKAAAEKTPAKKEIAPEAKPERKVADYEQRVEELRKKAEELRKRSEKLLEE